MQEAEAKLERNRVNDSGEVDRMESSVIVNTRADQKFGQ